MKYQFQFLFMIAFFGAYAQTESVEQTLIKMEDQRLKAIVNRDSIALSLLYDVSYRGILTTGREVNHAGVIEFQLTNNPFIRISIENVQATVNGNVAITTGKQVNRSKSGTILGHSRFMRVYLKKDNRWTIIFSQGTLIGGEEM